MKILYWIIFIVSALVAILFAIANRGSVAVSLDPFPVAFEAPLYLVVLAAAFVGLIGAALGVSRAAWRARQRVRRAEKRAKHAEIELARLRADAAAPPKPVEEPPRAAIDIS